MNARVLPWRIPPADSKNGILPDPYLVWMSEVMLQQTTVVTVKDYYQKFTSRWPTVSALATAKDQDVMAEWAGLGYYARARNLLKCARAVVSEFDGVFPQARDQLLKLPGIGPYTASAIASIAFGHSETVVDGNVERVMSRLFNVHTPLPTAKPELAALAASLTPLVRAGDYAQAVMDLGATVCTPRNPKCDECPLVINCLAKSAGTVVDLPKKLPKKKKPTRVGVAYIAQREDGAYLLQQRPDKGLLGGMLGWPGSDWDEILPEHEAPTVADWKTVDGEAKHTFTHFHLRLTVKTAKVAQGYNPSIGHFVPISDFDRSSLPTVMRKAFDLTQGNG
jgi:A/G-specific adenine glycosylase